MKSTQSRIALLVCALAESVHVVAGGQPAPQAPAVPDYNAYYQIGPDSLAHDGVPRGEMRGPFVLPSQAYPGTQHTYWVYVPAQYDPALAASLMIFQDGQSLKSYIATRRSLNLSQGEMAEMLHPAGEKLLAVRQKWQRPLLDNKIMTDWNGLMIAAIPSLVARSTAAS